MVFSALLTLDLRDGKKIFRNGTAPGEVKIARTQFLATGSMVSP